MKRPPTPRSNDDGPSKSLGTWGPSIVKLLAALIDLYSHSN